MRKILVFEAYPFFSGSQRVTKNVCEILKGAGYHITLVLADDAQGILREKFREQADAVVLLDTPAELRRYGNASQWLNPWIALQIILFKMPSFYKRLRKVVKQVDPDTIYFCDPRGMVMLLPATIALRARKFLHVHSKIRLPGLFMRGVLALCDKVICVSRAVAASLPASKKIICVYNGVDFSQYELVDATVVAKKIVELVSAPTSLVLLFVGLLKPHKGLHHVVDLMLALKKERPKQCLDLFILGEAQSDIEATYVQVLKEKISAASLVSCVHWMGWRNDVIAWMRSCDYLIFPSIDREKNVYPGFGEFIESTEALPTVLIEAGLCELFAIASRVTGVEEIVHEGFNGILYDSSDAQALGQTFKRVLDENLQFVKFPRREYFSTEVFQKKILELFQESLTVLSK